MQYQPYLSAAPPPPPPPYQFMTPPSQHHPELRHFPVESTPESEISQSDDTTTSATASGSRKVWDNDDTDILVQCWTEVQRRYKAMPKTKLGKKKVLKPRGTELWREITEKVNLLASVDRKPSQVELKMKKIINAYKEVKIKNSKSGSNPITCPYYEILEEILGTRDNIVPEYVIESNVLPVEERDEVRDKVLDKGDDNGDDEEKENEACDDRRMRRKREIEYEDKVKKKVVGIMSESLQLMKSMAEESRKNQELFKVLIGKF